MSSHITSSQVIDIGFPVFLTAYDPSDLPGGSIDPLGFERGYLFLADKILPGLTNVASWPRYISVLCAGAYLAEIDNHAPPRTQLQKRMECVLRFERFWALANVLASERFPDEGLSDSGIRGITYVTRKAAQLTNGAVTQTYADYKLLARQMPYGAVGIYGSVAEGMRFWERKTLRLTPDQGEKVGEGFLSETNIPPSIIRAVRDNGLVSVTRLAEWGRRAHISADSLPVEKKHLSDALHQNPIRSRMAMILAAHPLKAKGDSELRHLQRLLPALAEEESNRDLLEAVTAILAYERCYRLSALGLERLLWRCHTNVGSVKLTDLNSDSILKNVCDLLPSASARFGKALDSARSDQFRKELNRLEDVRRFLDSASAKCSSPQFFAEVLLVRHSDVQRGKFDRGRRKMPWIELNEGEIRLTMTNTGGSNKELTSADEITPHPYRLDTAYAFIKATELR